MIGFLIGMSLSIILLISLNKMKKKCSHLWLPKWSDGEFYRECFYCRKTKDDYGHS